MENKIFEYERKIEALEKKVADLEKRNESLREVLVKNVQFSTELSSITYEMDCLLVKKGHEIRDLQKKLEQSLATANSVKVDDFDIDMAIENDVDTEDSNSRQLDVNDYVVVFSFNTLELDRDMDGCFKCPECNYKTPSSRTVEEHYRLHTNKKPFGCKLCIQKRYRIKEGFHIDDNYFPIPDLSERGVHSIRLKTNLRVIVFVTFEAMMIA